MRTSSDLTQPALPSFAHKLSSDAGSLEAELAWLALVVSKRNRRNAEILISRLGFDGKGGATLQAIGDKYGLTRERVRQIESRASKLLSKKDVELPYLDRAVQLLNTIEFDVASDVQVQLQRAGITRGLFRVDGVVEAARICRRKCRAKIAEARGVAVVGRNDPEAVASWLASEGRRRSSKAGVANVPDLAETASGQFSLSVTEDAARRFLERLSGVTWLDSERDWYWYPDAPRNRLRNQVLKILSVSNGLAVSELRDAVRRWYRMQGVVPPKAIFEAFCEALPGVNVSEGRVTAEAPLSIEETLGTNERTIVEVLRENGGAMNSATLEKECLGRGLNISSFYVYLGYSSVVEKLGGGVYALRGARVLPGQVDELKATPKTEETLRDFGWTEDGRVWIAYWISHSILVSGVVAIPAGFKEFLQGEYSLKGPEGEDFGGFRCRNTQAWSLSKYWRRRGGDEGDPFVLMFNLSDRTVSVYLGADDLDDVVVGVSLDAEALDGD